MAFCQQCGAELKEGANFCDSCGANTQERQQSQQGANPLAGNILDTADETGNYDPADIEKNKAMGGLAYIIFFLPLVACPDSKYGRFHANQGLILLILGIAGAIVTSVLSSILHTIHWRMAFISSLIYAIVWLCVAAIGIIGLINGFSGKAKELPLIGKFRLIK
jgi:uncharacterized membrane protein